MGTVKESRWCFAWPAARQSVGGRDRAALVKASQWTSGSTISVSFLDGDPGVQDKVKKAAIGWTALGLANLSFDFRKDTSDTLVRISFLNAGSWSLIGTTCKQITDHTRPTMNFGWLTPESDDQEIQRVVLHEFGHALGLIHEHQNPAGGIQWDRAQVIKDLSGPPNHWDADTIQHNMFDTWGANETNYTKTDGASIMMYPIPANWTTNGFTIGLNTQLSPTDRQFIHQQYP